ncbi:MAG: T9SS type A sorting domain-containing protein [Flavobacteriaceae bacterium]|nr:MAG: T9SS type A sorting domain-containing protein [Flavobacteriaceae bacterium]
MNKSITLLFLLLFSINNSSAQCTTGFNGSNTAFTQAIRTGQTFQVSCSGLLSTIVFNPTNPNIDDLRGQNVFVGVRLKDVNGAVLANATINGASNTDQWFNGATITADFTAANLTLNANTTYRWEVFETTNDIALYLFGRNNTNSYALGNLFEDNASLSGVDAEDWTVNVQANLSADLFEKQDVRIYPNPTTNFITVTGLLNSETYVIYDMMGRQLQNGILNNNDTINIENLAIGKYLLQFSNGASSSILKN